MFAQERIKLGQNGLPNRCLGMGTDQIGHLVAKRWILKFNCRIVVHGGILLV